MPGGKYADGFISRISRLLGMCGIVGCFNTSNAGSKVKCGLLKLRNRGMDGAGSCDGKKVLHASSPEDLVPQKGRNCIGHVLHAIVDHVPNPVQGKGVIVANCEIYNWKELSMKCALNVRNDSELLLRLCDKDPKVIPKVLDELDGVYAFAYWRGSEIWIARDIIGVKPLWFSHGKGFFFASERKVLEEWGCKAIEELNPRSVLIYNIRTNRISIIRREFFASHPNIKGSEEDIRKELGQKLKSAVEKRVPDQKTGILFSGGVDSVLLARLLQLLGKDVTCYTVAVEEPGLMESEDLVFAKKAADALGLKLRTILLSLKDVEAEIAEVIPLIEETNAIKVGVAVTIHAAAKVAHKDGIKVLFSGTGSDDLFAGYDRHKPSATLNDDCLSGVRRLYERDLYRDDVVVMNCAVELRLPYLDKSLVRFALRIPPEFKIASDNKMILRRLAQDLGVPEFIAFRKKRAAQYGSRVDQALEKIAKRKGYNNKNALLAGYRKRKISIASLWSTGKDSAFAAYLMTTRNYEISCLVSLQSENPDSYMFHTPSIDLSRLHAKAMDVPLVLQKTLGEENDELCDLKKALQTAKKKFHIEGVVNGALYSSYQRDRIEKICDELGLKVYTPLWHMRQEEELRQVLLHNFRIIFTKVAAEGLDASWLGVQITSDHVQRLIALNKKLGVNVAGEGGEFESLVLDCPLFSREIIIRDASIKQDGLCAVLSIERTTLKKK